MRQVQPVSRPTPPVAGALLDMLLIALLFTAEYAWAGGGPESVAVIVNNDSWASKAVANAYVNHRDIPASNVIYLDEVPGFEVLEVEAFRRRILQPIFEAIEERGLQFQIDCIAYSTDLPYAVSFRKDFGDATPPQAITPTGSMNGLTFLYERVLAEDVAYSDLDANWYARDVERPRDLAPWPDQERSDYANATVALQARDLDLAERLMTPIAMKHSDNAPVMYNYACLLALLNRADDAMVALQRAVDAGWSDAAHTEADGDLESLRSRDDFKRLIDYIRTERVYPVRSSTAFRATDRWLRGGERSIDASGRRYMLSTMLAYTPGRGTSVSEAIENLRRSSVADGTRPDGTFYFMANSNVRSTTRQWGFASAVRALTDMGLRAEVINGQLPTNRPDVVGLMAGSATLDVPGAAITILPGAICEHLTSLGGVMRPNGGQTPLSAFIRAGAAGASGTVTEPYAIQAKFPTPMMHVHYARGCTLAEAFYQSLDGPYQLLIVGDPLCAPWAKSPELRFWGLKDEDVVADIRTIHTLPPQGAGPAIQVYQLFIDGSRLTACAPGGSMDLDTTRLSDGWHEARLVAISDDPVAATARRIIRFRVNNHQRRTSLRAMNRSVRLDQAVRIAAAVEGAQSIDILHNGRIVATGPGPSRTMDVEARSLGMGEVELTGIGRDLNGHEIGRTESIRISIEPPALLRARQSPPRRAPAAGFRVRAASGAVFVCDNTRKVTWLTDLGIKPDEGFTIEAVLRADASDVHQMQIMSNRPVEVRFDNAIPTQYSAGDWSYLPLNLESGWHEVSIVVAPGLGPPRLDVRFGLSGSLGIDGERFRHIE